MTEPIQEGKIFLLKRTEQATNEEGVPLCRECGNIIAKDDVETHLQQYWHKSCFRKSLERIAILKVELKDLLESIYDEPGIINEDSVILTELILNVNKLPLDEKEQVDIYKDKINSFFDSVDVLGIDKTFEVDISKTIDRIQLKICHNCGKEITAPTYRELSRVGNDEDVLESPFAYSHFDCPKEDT